MPKFLILEATMTLWLVFAIFIICIVASLVFDVTMLAPLFIGFVLFSALAVKRGFMLKSVLKMALESV